MSVSDRVKNPALLAAMAVASATATLGACLSLMFAAAPATRLGPTQASAAEPPPAPAGFPDS